MPPENERLAVVETKQKNADGEMKDLKDMILELTETVHEINQKMARMGGFISGIAFVFSLVGAAVVAAVDYAMRRSGS